MLGEFVYICMYFPGVDWVGGLEGAVLNWLGSGASSQSRDVLLPGKKMWSAKRD